jgi:hypothetical protein
MTLPDGAGRDQYRPPGFRYFLRTPQEARPRQLRRTTGRNGAQTPTQGRRERRDHALDTTALPYQ